MSRSVSESPFGFEITRVDCILNILEGLLSDKNRVWNIGT